MMQTTLPVEHPRLLSCNSVLPGHGQLRSKLPTALHHTRFVLGHHSPHMYRLQSGLELGMQPELHAGTPAVFLRPRPLHHSRNHQHTLLHQHTSQATASVKPVRQQAARLALLLQQQRQPLAP